MCWRAERGLPACEEQTVKLLDLADLRQSADCDCGEAAVDTVFDALGVRLTAASVLSSTAQDGAHPASIEAALRRAGLYVQSGTMTLADLQHHVRLGRPVLCPVSLHGGHWVVVRGVGRGCVYYQCPAVGPSRTRFLEWDEIWRDSTRAAHDFDRWGIAAGNG